MLQLKSYVRTDEHGVMRIGDSRVMLDSVVASFQQGYSAETIRQQYPALNLEEVYGAIAWYLANTEEVARYLERQAAVCDLEREKAAKRPNPVLQRLRALRESKASAPFRKRTLEHWEHGQRVPTGPVRAFLTASPREPDAGPVH